MADTFDPEDFWNARLAGMFRREGVGYQGLGEGFNRWAYKLTGRVFRRSTKFIRGDIREAEVLDVGSGIGFFLEHWQNLGVKSVVGADITDVAVEKLCALYPHLTILKLDIGSDDFPLDTDRFDAVTAMGVLFHIVDDQRYERAVQNLHRVLRPGGVMMYSDQFLHGGKRFVAKHQVSRPLNEIEPLMEQTGFEIVCRLPLRVLMSAPVDTDSWLLHKLWKFTMKVTGRGRLGSAAMGMGLYPLDVALTRLLKESPSMELMVCRKR